MAATMIPALGRDFAEPSLFDFAIDLVRTHAGLVRDDPARVAPPVYGPERPSFESMPQAQRLEIAQMVSDRPGYETALQDALPESLGYDRMLRLALDNNRSDAEVGQRVRRLILDYLSDVAAFRGDDLAAEVTSF